MSKHLGIRPPDVENRTPLTAPPPHRRRTYTAPALLGLAIAGCGAGASRPAWVDDPLDGVAERDGLVLAAVGQSDLAQGDPALARADAEADARSQIAAQLAACVRRLTARTSESLREHETGRIWGQSVVTDATEQVTRMVLVGSRPTATHWAPDATHPERVWVRIVVEVDPTELAKALAAAGDREARRRGIELRHDELLRGLDAAARSLEPPG